MRQFLLTLGFALVFVLPQPAKADVIVNQKDPVAIGVFVPCAADFVVLKGELHNLFALTFDNAGGVHVKFHSNPQGLSGESLTTGDKYQGTGVTQYEYNATVGFEETFIDRFDIIGQGPGNNFQVHITYHITVNANGTVTAFHDNVSIECK